MEKAVVCFSGGLDSTTLAYILKTEGYHLCLLGFDYGQRHIRELTSAEKIASLLGADFTSVNLSCLRDLLPGSSQTDEAVAVPDGHYAAATMKQTVVPNRNAIMLSIAYGHAVAVGAKLVGIAAHGGDHFIYPDCRPEFVAAMNKALKLGNEDFADPSLLIHAPFMGYSKADIVRLGAEMNVPYRLTWSCYKGGVHHCGKCGTCVERREAFRDAGVNDPTIYDEG